MQGPNLSIEAMALAPSRDRLVNEAAHRSVIRRGPDWAFCLAELHTRTDLRFV